MWLLSTRLMIGPESTLYKKYVHHVVGDAMRLAMFDRHWGDYTRNISPGKPHCFYSVIATLKTELTLFYFLLLLLVRFAFLLADVWDIGWGA